VPAARDLDEPGPAVAARHLLGAALEQQVRILAAQQEDGAADRVPVAPEGEVVEEASAEGAHDPGVVELVVASVLPALDAVHRQVPPLGVAEVAEGRQRRAMVGLGGRQVGEVPRRRTDGVADAPEGGPGQVGADVVDH
jgi:hypothetical protein